MSLCFCPIQFSFQINGLSTIFPKNSHCVLLPVPVLSLRYTLLYIASLSNLRTASRYPELPKQTIGGKYNYTSASYGHFRVPNGLERREGSKRRGGLCCQIKAKGVRALRTRKWAVCASGVWPGVGRLGLTVLAFAYIQLTIFRKCEKIDTSRMKLNAVSKFYTNLFSK